MQHNEPSSAASHVTGNPAAEAPAGAVTQDAAIEVNAAGQSVVPSTQAGQMSNEELIKFLETEFPGMTEADKKEVEDALKAGGLNLQSILQDFEEAELHRDYGLKPAYVRRVKRKFGGGGDGGGPAGGGGGGGGPAGGGGGGGGPAGGGGGGGGPAGGGGGGGGPAATKAWKQIPCPALNDNVQSLIFEIPKAYWDQSGLYFGQEKILLYRRQALEEEFEFLRQEVLSNSKLAWIIGPPGTGKSTAAFAFSTTLDRSKWVITWLHIPSQPGGVLCVRFDGDFKYTLVIGRSNLELLREVLKDGGIGSAKNHLVVLDGYVTSPSHLAICSECYDWLAEDMSRRRLVVVCSMASRGKVNDDYDRWRGVETHFVYSWTRSEFCEAVRIPAILDSVRPQLDSSVFTDAKDILIEDLIDSKVHFAGSSARYMFSMKTEDVVRVILNAISSTADVLPYLDGSIGDQSDHVVNRMIGCHLDSTGRRRRTIVSSFAATEMGMIKGADWVRSFALNAAISMNPAMDGFLFEMWVFAKLMSTGVELIPREASLAILKLKQAEVVNQDPFQEIKIPDSGELWVKPLKWNQGGYDAIYFNRGEQTVRFLQITRDASHSFKIEYFHMLLDQFRKGSSSYEIKKLEIFFVVPFHKLQDFYLNEISGQSLLIEFGWESGKEKDRAIFYGVKDWNSG